MKKTPSVLKSLFGLLRETPWTIPLIAFLGTLSSLAEGIGIGLFIPLLKYFYSVTNGDDSGGWLSQAVSRVIEAMPATNRLSAICMLILVMIVAKGALMYGNRMVSEWVNSRLGHRLRVGIFEQLLIVKYRFLEQVESGAHLNTLATETWRVTGALSTLHSMTANICTTLVFLAMLMMLSWQLTLVVMLAMGCIALIMRVLTRGVKRLGKEGMLANARLAKRMVEGLAGMKVIRLFGRERYELGRFEEASDHVRKSFFKLGMIGAVISPAYEILSAVLLVGLLFFTDTIGIDLPTLLVFILLLYRLEPRVMALDEARVSIVSSGASVEQVCSLLEQRDKEYEASGTVQFGSLQEGIRFDNVTFSYGAHHGPALQDISAFIPKGKTTAIVGPSGAGKSTMVKLLLRLYDVSDGAIHVDSTPLSSLNVASWRNRIAMVSQDVFLFDTSVRDNIAYGKEGATEQEIRDAARQADADRFISTLPGGFEAAVGDGGSLLSSGQRQRIALARAIIREPEILIMDEAMNALDSISEQFIQDAMDVLAPGRTVVIIAHRLSTISRADHIIVLDDGRVKEQGSLEDLQKSSLLFSRLYSVPSTVS
jgi:ATP-binding cassette, subfamily B, bacterial MsbA